MGHTSVKHEKYEPKIMATILLLLTNAQKLNQPRLFEVYVNDLAVVPKTGDIAQLEEYQDYITEETTIIKIFVYHYNQKSSDKFFLHITPESFQEAKSRELGSVATPKIEDALKQKWEQDSHYEFLKNENLELTTQLDVEKKAAASARRELVLVRAQRDREFKEKAAQALEGIMESDYVKKNLPLIGVIKQFFGGEAFTPNEDLSGSEENNEGTVEEEEIEEIHQRVLTTEEEKHLLLLKDIKAKVGTTHLASIMYLLDLFAFNPNSIDSAIKVVKNYIAQKPKITPEAETEIN